MDDELLNITEAGERMTISAHMVRKMIDAGQIEAVDVSPDTSRPMWRIRRSVVERTLRERRVPRAVGRTRRPNVERMRELGGPRAGWLEGGGVYFAQNDERKLIKVGFTRNVTGRFASGLSEYDLVGWIPCASELEARLVEAAIHYQLESFQIHGLGREWFGPATDVMHRLRPLIDEPTKAVAKAIERMLHERKEIRKQEERG
jgi:hypothetical protein